MYSYSESRTVDLGLTCQLPTIDLPLRTMSTCQDLIGDGRDLQVENFLKKALKCAQRAHDAAAAAAATAPLGGGGGGSHPGGRGHAGPRLRRRHRRRHRSRSHPGDPRLPLAEVKNRAGPPPGTIPKQQSAVSSPRQKFMVVTSTAHERVQGASTRIQREASLRGVRVGVPVAPDLAGALLHVDLGGGGGEAPDARARFLIRHLTPHTPPTQSPMM